jgi:hypothetical protein
MTNEILAADRSDLDEDRPEVLARDLLTGERLAQYLFRDPAARHEEMTE